MDEVNKYLSREGSMAKVPDAVGKLWITEGRD